MSEDIDKVALRGMLDAYEKEFNGDQHSVVLDILWSAIKDLRASINDRQINEDRDQGRS